jgi:Tol biopolymer transport system component
MSRLTLLVPIALSAVACGGCGCSSDRESELPAKRSALIAFVRGDPGDLVVVDPDGSNERILVKGSRGPDLAGFDRVFSWSPNGRQLLYSVEAPVDTGDVADYYVDIYVVNADGSDRRKLMRANIWTDLVWSPRGDAVLIGDQHLGFRQLMVVNADGSGARTISGGDDVGNYDWSPDGRKIAYDKSSASVYVMNADGSAPKRLTDGFYPEWTPGGQIIVRFVEEDWLINPDGSGLRRAGRFGELTGSGELAPDGRTIALAKAIGGSDYELALGDVGGGPLRRLTDNEMEDDWPSWSPTGKSLVFERRPSDDDDLALGDIFVINADGTGERNLTNSAADENSPAWAPR